MEHSSAWRSPWPGASSAFYPSSPTQHPLTSQSPRFHPEPRSGRGPGTTGWGSHWNQSQDTVGGVWWVVGGHPQVWLQGQAVWGSSVSSVAMGHLLRMGKRWEIASYARWLCSKPIIDLASIILTMTVGSLGLILFADEEIEAAFFPFSQPVSSSVRWSWEVTFF